MARYARGRAGATHRTQTLPGEQPVGAALTGFRDGLGGEGVGRRGMWTAARPAQGEGRTGTPGAAALLSAWSAATLMRAATWWKFGSVGATPVCRTVTSWLEASATKA